MRYKTTSLALALASLGAACALPGTAHADNIFTVAVVPDTQNYTDVTKPAGNLNDFTAEMSYLANNKSTLNLAFTTFVGDIVQHGDGTNGTPGNASWGAGAEWARANQAIGILAASGTPFGMAPGNHDYNNYSYATGSRPLAGSSSWVSNFGSGSTYFAGKSWYGGASNSLAVDPGMSSYQTFTAGGVKFLSLELQMEPGDAALAWAQSVINAHPGMPTIVTTHEYLNPPAQGDTRAPLAVPATRANDGYLTGSAGGQNGAQGIWDKFIKKNAQIFMTINGHAWNPTVNGVSTSENIRIDTNDAGESVYQILSDYQGNTIGPNGVIGSDPGGDGWLRLMQFDLTTGKIHFETYSPTLNEYAGLNGDNTFGQPAAFSDFSLDMPMQVTSAEVPEPASFGLVLTGLGLLGAAARRKRAAA